MGPHRIGLKEPKTLGKYTTPTTVPRRPQDTYHLNNTVREGISYFSLWIQTWILPASKTSVNSTCLTPVT